MRSLLQDSQLTSALSLLEIATTSDPTLQRSHTFKAALDAVKRHVQQRGHLRDDSGECLQRCTVSQEPAAAADDAEPCTDSSDVRWRAIEGHAALQVDRAAGLQPVFPSATCGVAAAPAVPPCPTGTASVRQNSQDGTLDADSDSRLEGTAMSSAAAAEPCVGATPHVSCPPTANAAEAAANADAADAKAAEHADRLAPSSVSTSGRETPFDVNASQGQASGVAIAALRQALASARPLQQATGLLRYMRSCDAQVWPQGADARNSACV